MADNTAETTKPITASVEPKTNRWAFLEGIKKKFSREKPKQITALVARTEVDEYSAREKELLSTDPRDYIPEMAVQKLARSIDQDPSHPWEENLQNYALSRDKNGDIVVATVFDTRTLESKLLITEKESDVASSSIYFEGLSQEQRNNIAYITTEAVRLLPGRAKHIFIRKLQELTPQIKQMSPEQITPKLCFLALELLPGVTQDIPNPLSPVFPKAIFGPAFPTSEQNSQLLSFLGLVRHKIAEHVFQKEFQNLLNNMPSTDEVYGRNFRFLFTDILSWLKQREDIKQHLSQISTQADIKSFSVKEIIRNKITSLEQLGQTLAEMGSKPEADTRFMRYAPKKVEFVPLDKVVGGPRINNWANISTSENRGMGNVYKFAQGFQDGSIDVNGRNMPISVSEINGDYFIQGDGRHRVAALKALDVKFAPMIVTHYFLP